MEKYKDIICSLFHKIGDLLLTEIGLFANLIYPSPLWGGEFRLTDTESGTNAKRVRSAAVARIAAGGDKGKVSSGNHISQPPCSPVANSGRFQSKERQLPFLNTVIARNTVAVRYRAENTTSVNHVFTHQVNSTVCPLTSRSSAVGNSVREINSVRQNVRTSKRTVDSRLRLRQVRRVHGRAFVCTSGHAGSVHLSIVQAGIRHNDCVVFCKIGITAVQVIVKRRNTPVHAADNPVITNVQVSESTTGNSFPLFLRYGSAKVLPSVDRVVRPGIAAILCSSKVFPSGICIAIKFTPNCYFVRAKRKCQLSSVLIIKRSGLNY